MPLTGFWDTNKWNHIYNNNLIELEKFLKFSKINFTIIPDNKMIELVKNSSNPLSLHILNDLINTKLNITPTKNEKTTNILNKNGFYWNQTDEEYINKFLSLFK